MSAPSGAGKTTIVAGVLKRRPDYVLSLSATTRRPRPGETDGVDYRFLTEEAFERLEREGAFLETARVHGNRYGTPREDVERALAGGSTVLLEIDVQGARSIRRLFPDAMLVFVEPPSFEVLAERLRGRGTDDEATVAERLANARRELAAVSEFDRSVVNEDLEAAVEDLIRIIEGETAPSGGRSPKENP